MAIKTYLVDDIDGSDAEVTIAFVVNGKSYSVDLSKQNADKFWKAINPYVKAAEKNTSSREAEVQKYEQASEQRNTIREWAKKQGYEIADRGRIPIDIQEAYEESHR